MAVNFRKAPIKAETRRALAIRYGCEPGQCVLVKCHYCEFTSEIQWFLGATKRKNSFGWAAFGEFEIDHVVPEFHGGATHESNLVLACLKCNRSKGHKQKPFVGSL